MLRRITDPDDSTLAEEVSPNWWKVYNHYEEHSSKKYPFFVYSWSVDEVEIRNFAERRFLQYQSRLC